MELTTRESAGLATLEPPLKCRCSAHAALAPAATFPSAFGPLDVAAVRADFPLLTALCEASEPLVYLDNAATSHKPAIVLDAERDFNRLHNANVHRGHHRLSREATELYEWSRERIAAFIGAAPDEVIFTKNASEALNLVAQSLANASNTERPYRSLALGPGDVVVITEMEHHSNLMPWQDLCRRTGAELRWLTITPDGRLDLSDLERIVSYETKVMAFAHQSNLYGTLNPVDVLVARAHEVGALTVLDACQSVPHYPVDVTKLGVDFLAFSGHKTCGPTGIGVLWGRSELLKAMPPFLTGGEMNEEVAMGRSTYAEPPARFEAGTPPIAQAIGLAAACGYLRDLGMERVAAHEHALTVRALDGMREVPSLRIVGPPDSVDRGPAISFAISGMFADDIGEALDQRGIGIRVGQMCARPACLRFGLPATTRASFHVYTSPAEVDQLVQALHEIAPRPVATPGISLPAREPEKVNTTMTDPPVDAAVAFQQKVILDAATAVTALSVSLGDRLGLYRALAGAGPLTPAELARRTGTTEVYIREWLHSQVGAGYLEHDEANDLFLLPDSHAAVLATPDAATSAVGIYQVLQSLYRSEDELLEAFRTGSGIGWDAHDSTLYPGIGRFFRPKYAANVVPNWLPALDGVVEKLTAGATVADVGCGVGYSTLLMAEAFPRSRFIGTDYHPGSIERARMLAEERGLDHRVRFEVAAADNFAGTSTGAGFDLVTFFDCLHDMGNPLAASRRVRETLAPDGTWMLVEPNGKPLPSQNTTPPGRLFMAISPVLCLPSALAQKGPYALGNHGGEDALHAIATEAGFTGWRLAAQTPANSIYEIRH